MFGHATVESYLVVGDVYFLHHFRGLQVKNKGKEYSRSIDIVCDTRRYVC
jgi:hypothetical protein